MSNEEIYEKVFYNTEVPPQDTFDRRVALSAMDAARKDEAIALLAWVKLNYILDNNRGYYSIFNDGSHSKSHITPKFYTTEQLYQIFKTQTNG